LNFCESFSWSEPKAVKHATRRNSPTFVKPTEKAVAAYDATIVNAVRSANLDALRSAHKESLNAGNRFGESLLHMACRRGNVEVVRYMVEEAKVNVHVRDDYGLDGSP
jgi:ankyrin repeat protein